MNTTVKTDLIIDLAFAAYRVNNGYVKATQRYSEGQPTTFSNKELITFTAHSEWQPEDFVALTVTEEDKEARKKCDKHMRRYTMLAMGDLPQFEDDLFQAYNSEETNISRVGLVAYLPAFIDRELANKEYKLRLRTEFNESKHLNGDRLEPTEVEILKVIPLNNDFMEQAFMHFGAIGKDLVCFTVKNKFTVNNTYDIVARIKGQDYERESKTPMTRLNYVKLRKQEA
jgi:hypothetical protein